MSCSTLSTCGMLNLVAASLALAASRSAQAAISTIGKFLAMPRYAPLIAPHPTTPTRTLFDMKMILRFQKRLSWIHLRAALADERFQLVRPKAGGSSQNDGTSAAAAGDLLADLGSLGGGLVEL